MVTQTSAFQQFVETEYKLSYWASQQQDGARRRPLVKPAAIFRAAVGQAAWGLDSLLKLDQRLRTRTAQRFIGQSPHARWAIENNGFKHLNAAVGSKKAYLKDAAAKEALLLLWGIGLALAEAYWVWLEGQAAWRDWGVKETAWLLSQWIQWSAVPGELLGCGGSA